MRVVCVKFGHFSKSCATTCGEHLVSYDTPDRNSNIQMEVGGSVMATLAQPICFDGELKPKGILLYVGV